jgi:regulatory protein
MGFKGKRFGSKDPDLSLSDEEWDERARGWLLAKLTRGPRTKLQLAQLLSQRGVPEAIAEPLLARFEDVGLIDDAAYARAFTHDRRATRGLAKSALKRELNQAGVAVEHIEAALEGIEAEDDHQLAVQLVRKRWSSVVGLDAQARQRRLLGYLGRRGFSSNTISSAIRSVEQES